VSSHATTLRKFFQDYVEGDFGQVYLGDDELCKIVGNGNGMDKTTKLKPKVVEEVIHVC